MIKTTINDIRYWVDRITEAENRPNFGIGSLEISNEKHFKGCIVYEIADYNGGLNDYLGFGRQPIKVIDMLLNLKLSEIEKQKIMVDEAIVNLKEKVMAEMLEQYLPKKEAPIKPKLNKI